MRKIIFCVLFAVLFHPALVLASDYGVGAYVDRTDDFRRQKDELRRMNEISEQVDQDRREADEVFRQRRYEDKVIKQTLKLEEQKARASQKAARDQLLVKAPSASGNTLFDIILAWIFRYGLYLLIPACCWFSYYYTVIFLRKKTPAG